jgi:hypothetical protein
MRTAVLGTERTLKLWRRSGTLRYLFLPDLAGAFFGAGFAVFAGFAALAPAPFFAGAALATGFAGAFCSGLGLGAGLGFGAGLGLGADLVLGTGLVALGGDAFALTAAFAGAFGIGLA